MTSERLVLHSRVLRGSWGGPDKTILNSPRSLKGKGYEMLCVYMRHPEDPYFADLEVQARRWHARVIAVDDHGPLDWRILGNLRRICKEHRPAIWHGHDYKSNLSGLLLRRHQPMSLVTTVHGWVKSTWKTPFYYAIDRICLRRYEAVVCVSEDLYAACLRLGIPPERCWHVPNAIDTEEFRRNEPRETAKARLGVDCSRFLVGAMGRLSKEKGFHLLIQALHRLLTEGVEVELWIAGEGDEEANLRRLITSLGLADRVKLLGFQTDVLGFYHAIDVFALSSLREGLPNVLLEAMALEDPVVSTRVAGVPGLIRPEENGLLVDASSADGLATALRRLHLDPQLRQRLGRAARESVERSYGLARRMEAIRRIYETILSQAKPGNAYPRHARSQV